MGQLFDRISQIIRSELNHLDSNTFSVELGAGPAFVITGATSGVSIGKIGILAGGSGFSVGGIPLAGAGILTGAAVYETIKALVEGDASSVGAVTAGATVGAGISAAIGGMGVSIGGTAFGVGMAHMAVAGGVAGLGIAGLHRLLQQGIDPEKLLELAIEEMEEDLEKCYNAALEVVAGYKYRELKYHEDHSDQIENIKRRYAAVKRKVSEAKANKATLKALIAAVKAQAAIQSTIGQLNTRSVMTAYERMEEKILQMEARAQVAGELAGNDLESQFFLVQPASDVDDELMAMKAQLTGAFPNHVSLPSSSQFNTQPSDSSSKLSVDKDLEELRRQMDQL